MDVQSFKEIVYANGGKPITINYTNWQNKTEERVIIPKHIIFTKTTWHPTEQWCVVAWCNHRQDERVFAIADIHTCEVNERLTTFSVKCDEENNPQEVQEQNRLVVEIRLDKELIKHAAVKSLDGFIFIGKSHADCFHKASHVKVKMSQKADDQGFLTSHGRYVYRGEAARIAVASGQVGSSIKILFSEELWSPTDNGKHVYDEIKGYVEAHSES